MYAVTHICTIQFSVLELLTYLLYLPPFLFLSVVWTLESGLVFLCIHLHVIAFALSATQACIRYETCWPDYGLLDLKRHICFCMSPWFGSDILEGNLNDCDPVLEIAWYLQALAM